MDRVDAITGEHPSRAVPDHDLHRALVLLQQEHGLDKRLGVVVEEFDGERRRNPVGVSGVKCVIFQLYDSHLAGARGLSPKLSVAKRHNKPSSR